MVTQTNTNVVDDFGNEVGTDDVINVKAQTLDELLGLYKTKSGVIRYLASCGWKRGAIAKFMDIRYQHVRNVLTQPLKKEG